MWLIHLRACTFAQWSPYEIVKIWRKSARHSRNAQNHTCPVLVFSGRTRARNDRGKRQAGKNAASVRFKYCKRYQQLPFRCRKLYACHALPCGIDLITQDQATMIDIVNWSRHSLVLGLTIYSSSRFHISPPHMDSNNPVPPSEGA